MEYVTIASTGNATDFGDLTTARDNQLDGIKFSVRGVLLEEMIPNLQMQLNM